MKQIFQNLKTGEITLPEVPTPDVGAKSVLIRGRTSLISLGTEKMLLQFGQSSWIGKALSHPERVEQVLSKIKTDGIIPTLEAVKNKLDRPLPLGYSHVGEVMAVGPQVKSVRVGDRVVSNGPHAEVVCVPENLCAKIPDGVSNEDAAFTVLSSIGLQGLRLLSPQLGETVAVIGLGLIGQLTVQLLRANGCRVIGLDLDARKVELARSFGAEALLVGEADPVEKVLNLTHGRGVDGVLITASTKNSAPAQWAPQMCRQRGKVVLVGVVDLSLKREDFYEKEISFQVSCSYGPGRYDSSYEEKGVDYPYGLVRWTENRNFSAVLDLMAQKKLDPSSLIDQRVDFTSASALYQKLGEDSSSLGILLQYPEQIELKRTLPLERKIRNENRIKVGFIGAGNFAGARLLPELQKYGVDLVTIASASGGSSFFQGQKWGFSQCSSDWKSVVSDPNINTIFIATPHHLHAQMVCAALSAGKHVFVEKPLCLKLSELEQIQEVLEHDQSGVELCVGFNRRYSSLTQKMKQLVSDIHTPMSLVMTVNAGTVDAEHWIQDTERGGGRLIGEACHFIDLAYFMVGKSVSGMQSFFGGSAQKDSFTIQLSFTDGSQASIHYFSQGHKDFPKERLEVFAGGKILVLDNFRSLTGYGFKDFNKLKVLSMDKGHDELISRFFAALQKKSERAIARQDILTVSRLAILASESSESMIHP